MSERLKGRKLSEEIRKKLKGRIINEKTRRAVSLAHKGKKLSEEHRTKISKAKKGTKQSKETLEKLSIIRKKNYENSHVKKINEARIARQRRKLAENPNYLKEQKRLINKRWRDKKKFKQSINV